MAKTNASYNRNICPYKVHAVQWWYLLRIGHTTPTIGIKSYAQVNIANQPFVDFCYDFTRFNGRPLLRSHLDYLVVLFLKVNQ